MAVPFGFSVGDFIATITLVKDVIKALNDSTGARPAYKRLQVELSNLDAALTQVQNLEVHATQEPQKAALKTVAAACQESIERFLDQNAKFQGTLGNTPSCSSSPTSWESWRLKLHKVQWARFKNDSINALRGEIAGHTAAINIIFNDIQAATLKVNADAIDTCKESIQTLHVLGHETVTYLTKNTSLLTTQADILTSMSQTVTATNNSASSIESIVQQNLEHSTTSSRRFESLLMQLLSRLTTGDESQQDVPPAVATGRILGKPAVLRDICDAAGASDVSRGAAEIGSAISTYTKGKFPCSCRHRRQFKRRRVFWGPLSLSHEMATEQHLAGCPAAQVLINTDRSQTIALTYTGLRRLLDSAVQISFAMRQGAGGWSLSPNITYYPTVDYFTAPAFRMLNLLTYSPVECWEELVPLVVSAIIRLFQAGKANPRAVDADNRSLVYHLAEQMAEAQHRADAHSQGSLLELLEYLLINKTPANDYDLYGETPLSALTRKCSYNIIAAPLPAAAAELILRQDAEGNLACLSTPGPASHWSYVPRLTNRPQMHLDLVSCSSRVAEAFGCGPLSLAVLSDNREHVERLVDTHPVTLAERNLFGHTPLHLAADKPACLQILVQAANPKLINQTDAYGYSALETAMALKLDYLLDLASVRCKLRYIRHIKDRRDRLKQLALDNFPAMEIERLGLASGDVLDSLAPRVIELLQDHGVPIPEALVVTRTEPNGRSSPASIYQVLREPWDAELFFRHGFHETESWCEAEATGLRWFYNDDEKPDLPYLHWLSKHGASSCQLKCFDTERGIFMTNHTFWVIGKNLYAAGWGTPWFSGEDLIAYTGCESLSLDNRIAWIDEVNSAVLPAKIADNCSCKCSPGGCTPVTSMLKGVLREVSYTLRLRRGQPPDESLTEDTDSQEDMPEWMNIRDDGITLFTRYLQLFGKHFDFRHHTAALRYVTFTALGIPHSCCDPDVYDGEDKRLPIPEEVVEVEDEHAYELRLLEELLLEFEGHLTAILQDPNRGIADVIRFWNRTWVNRMREVLDHLEGNRLTDDERRKAEEIGVVWDRPESPEVMDNPYSWDQMEHWIYKLEKIEAECQ
ncbi:hypothetical protein CONLIGDRAFT_180622 [Coniochaeta ligniaria NRRL 30616]|uniref:Uncharacterized protein n=1 Tax=Coniochaeta ligniaria NRRL 30616 TaxID=1408157 RepID=A0A1J7J291_9PEZI|nr:hypothetical protein CONLIGDRAFT_180622 [Coniochaeta ligniaria NRRL 30616]